MYLSLKKETKWKNCRSFKNFNHDLFLEDLTDLNLESEITNADVNEGYEIFEENVIKVMDKDAPFKKKLRENM